MDDLFLDLSNLHNNYNACLIEMVLNLTFPGVKSRGVVQLILELLLKKWFPMPKSGISYPKSHIWGLGLISGFP